MLPFEVLPAWHQTWVFRAGALLALGLSAVGLLRLRERSLQQRQTALARAVDERTTQLRELTLRLAEQGEALNLASRTDPLTGLHNRRHLVQRMQGQDSVQPLALLLVDVDHFKQVNDQRGHAVGDAALVAMAARLRPLLGERDECVRWGGEEFLLVLDGADVARAQALAETVRHRVADEPLVLRGHGHLQLTVSTGFACLPFVAGAPRALDWEAVLSLADQALYAAKRLGRNRWVGLAAGAAADPAHAEGLPQRAHTDPAGCLARGELRALVAEADAAGVAAALQG
jgi:diguanylate cyclase (GGDEF)-like protein